MCYLTPIYVCNAHALQVGTLEFSQYLEQYLWPAFDATTASAEHVLSIVLMVNEKLREQAPGWEAFESEPEQFSAFFRRVRQLCLSKDASVSLRQRGLAKNPIERVDNSVHTDVF